MSHANRAVTMKKVPLNFRAAKLGVFGCNAKVAGIGKLQAACKAIAINGGDHGLGSHADAGARRASRRLAAESKLA